MDDILDEDVELEIQDVTLSRAIASIYKDHHPNTLDRNIYLTGLIQMQAELIKLQDWVPHPKGKVVVLFEGGDNADKGGVIKRIAATA